MKDTSCVTFLQWALPRLKMRWRGFRKVRRQVCRRIDKRIAALNLHTIDRYKDYLEEHPDEWIVLDGLCRITISRFYRDKVVFDYFIADVLPAVLNRCKTSHNKTLRVWSAGCASGEEPYTVAILWHVLFRHQHPDIKLEILATDADPVMLRRAQKACYEMSSISNLPAEWLEGAFTERDGLYCLHDHLKEYVRFECRDIRKDTPEEQYHVVLCRNLAFTYFDGGVQEMVLRRISYVMADHGVLITGNHEVVAGEKSGFAPWVEHMPIFFRAESCAYKVD